MHVLLSSRNNIFLFFSFSPSLLPAIHMLPLLRMPLIVLSIILPIDGTDFALRQMIAQTAYTVVDLSVVIIYGAKAFRNSHSKPLPSS